MVVPVLRVIVLPNDIAEDKMCEVTTTLSYTCRGPDSARSGQPHDIRLCTQGRAPKRTSSLGIQSCCLGLKILNGSNQTMGLRICARGLPSTSKDLESICTSRK